MHQRSGWTGIYNVVAVLSARGTFTSRTGVGTVIARKSTAKGKTYRRIWIYVPSRVSEDTSFPFRAGDPVEVALEKNGEGMSIRPISVGKALQRGWTKRRRFSRTEEGS